MKKLIAVIMMGFFLGACAHYTPSTSYEERQNQRIKWQIERQLDHERIVRDCQMYNTCRGAYKIYNSDPDKRR